MLISSTLFHEIVDAIAKACGYVVTMSRHDGFSFEGQAVTNGLFGFKRFTYSPNDTEYTYLGYQTLISRPRLYPQ